MLGQFDLIIGTHALIQNGVSYKNLALVITDEQHRFGVNQRKNFFEKGENPHVLVTECDTYSENTCNNDLWRHGFVSC